MNEQIDRAESDTRASLEIAFADLEKRQVEQLDRAASREVDRLSEAGALEFENRMRAIREEAAGRLQQEFDRMSRPSCGARTSRSRISSSRSPTTPRSASRPGSTRPRGATRQCVRPSTVSDTNPPSRAGFDRLGARLRLGSDRLRTAARGQLLRGRERLSHSEKTTRMAETTETTPLWNENEPAKVESWRLHILLEGGYPVHLAERLAASEVDLHDAVEA